MPNHSNPPGKGTVNLSINLFEGERTILVKLAIQKNQSLGAFMRDLACDGLRSVCPVSAETFRSVRRTARQERLVTK
jgi:hypothetical protein